MSAVTILRLRGWLVHFIWARDRSEGEFVCVRVCDFVYSDRDSLVVRGQGNTVESAILTASRNKHA